jgi:hypothetical protein
MAASSGPLPGRFYSKRTTQKPREKLRVWLQLRLLAARSHPEAEPNRGNIIWLICLVDPVAYILLYDVCACYPDVLAQLLSKALLPLLMNRPMLQQLSKQLHVILHQTRRSNLQGKSFPGEGQCARNLHMY